MSDYLAQANLAQNAEFNRRVNQCVVQETSLWPEPPIASTVDITAIIIPTVAASPGFDVSYIWGDQANGVKPGNLAISDGQVLSAVQPLLEQFRPPAAP